MPKDPLTARAVWKTCLYGNLIADGDDIGPLWKHLTAWEAHQTEFPGRRYTPARRVIYFLQEALTGYIKIGRANNPIQRPRVAGSGVSVRHPVLCVRPEREGLMERDLHRRFARWRVPGSTEWYLPVPEIVAFAGATPRKVLWGHSDLMEAITALEADIQAGVVPLPENSKLAHAA
jgi:hypothetical protein